MKINNIAQFFRSKKAEIFENIRIIGRSMIIGGLLSAFAPTSLGVGWLALVIIGFVLWVWALYLSKEPDKN